MAGPAPKTEKWTARENRHEPEGLHLLVGGTVEVSASNLAPLLAVAEDEGDVLSLDLTLVEGLDPVVEDRGKPVAVWKAAHHHAVVTENQYHYVEVRWDGRPIAKIPVINDLEHADLMEKQAEVQDTVVGKATGAKQKAKKAKKAVAKVVEAVGDLAKGAKKAVKKVVKKAAKKVTRTAAPKKAAKAAAKKTAKSSKKAAKKAPARKAARKVAKKTAKKSAKKKAKRR